MDKILILDKLNCIKHVLKSDPGEKKNKATEAHLEAWNLDLDKKTQKKGNKGLSGSMQS
jgi:hypothetical protein